MARAGVNYANVLEAAESIAASGNDPTVDRVRLYLGTGSKSTIAPLLKRWKAENSDSQEVSGLPNDVIQAIQALHQRLMDDADRKVGEAESSFVARIEDMEKQLADKKRELSSAVDREDFLKSQLEALEVLQQANKDYQIQIATITAENSAVNQQNNELKQALKDAKSETKAAREQSEHFQLRTAEDRDAERGMFQQTLSDLKAANSSLQAELNKELEQRSDLTTDLSNQLRLSSEFETEAKAQSKRSELAEQQVETLAAKLEDLSKISSRYEQELSLTKSLQIELHTKLERFQFETTTLQRQLEQSDKDKEVLKNKLETYIDKNETLTEEKSMLKGQLLQLQKSL